MKISFIIVSWNTREKTCACIESIQKYMPQHEIVVVDNNSYDDSCERIKTDYPDVKLIENDDNRGFGAANNQGAAISSGDVLCFTNSDTEVLDDGLVSYGNELLKTLSVGVIAPRIIFGDGRFQYSYERFPDQISCILAFGIEFFMPFKSWYADWKKYYRKQFKGRRKVDWVSGCCLLMRTELFRKINGWDEKFFAYFEDPDLCRRVKEVGCSSVYEPRTTIVHHHGASFSQHNWAYRINNRIESSAIYLFGNTTCKKSLFYRKRIRRCWGAILFFSQPFKGNKKVGDKRLLLSELIQFFDKTM